MTRDRWIILSGFVMGLLFIVINGLSPVVTLKPPFLAGVLVGVVGNIVGRIIAANWLDAGR